MADLTEDQKTIVTLNTQVEKLKGELLAAETVISDLKEKLEAKEASTVKLPALKIGKDTYELVSPFFYKDQEVTIDVLKDNAKLAEELVKEGIANLRKLVTKA